METKMENIIDYTVIRAWDLSTLRVEINSYLKKGRVPFWNLQIVSNWWVAMTFYQPIVKYWPLDSNSNK